MRVIFDPQAQAEFDDVCRYYNPQKTGLGDDFTEMVRQGLRRVLTQPESCTVEFDDVRRRVLKRFPYKLLYSVETAHLYVIAVAHQHRKPSYWHDRIENS